MDGKGIEPYLKASAIGSVELRPPLVLSPMSGVTHSPFRRLIKELNPGCVGMVVSEFVSIEGLTRASVRSHEMMQFREEERPYCIQIFGYDVERMKSAALMAQETGADMVDINCGCPAPKVVKRGGGCELMRQPEHLKTMLREVRKVVEVPLTIKFRSGWGEENKNALEIARIAEGEGLDGIAIHGRTRTQLYRGEADWELVRQVVNAVSIPVAGSGDVVDYGSALERFQSGVKSLFIGRAALSNPLVFSDICSGRSSTLRDSPDKMLAILNRYAELLLDDFTPKSCVGRLKQLTSQMCKGQSWAKELCRSNTLEEQLAVLQRESASVGSPQSVCGLAIEFNGEFNGNLNAASNGASMGGGAPSGSSGIFEGQQQSLEGSAL